MSFKMSFKIAKRRIMTITIRIVTGKLFFFWLIHFECINIAYILLSFFFFNNHMLSNIRIKIKNYV